MKHYHHPLNKGKLQKFDEHFEGINPFCGDELEMWIQLDNDKRISKIGWDGKGCVISQSATSIFSDMVIGKTLNEVRTLDKDDILSELQIELSPTRIKCALLSLFTLKGETDIFI